MRIFGALDLRKPTSGGSLPQSVINVIEANTGTQVDVVVGYTEVEWLGDVPVNVSKWVDSTKTAKVYDIDITWLGGVPVTIVSNNLYDGIITTTTITWSNGVPVSIAKV